MAPHAVLTPPPYPALVLPGHTESMMSTRNILAISIAALAGCGGDGGGGNGGDVPVNQIGEQFGRVSCERMFECCNAQELMEELEFFNVDTVDDCAMVFAGFIGGFLEPQIEASVASGRLIYRADRMAECVDRFRAMSCAELAQAMTTDDFGDSGVCRDPFVGQVPDGQACASDLECQSETCIGESMDFEGNVTEGTCGSPPGPGDACDFGECGGGAYCEFGASGEMCAAAKSSGAECSSDDECTSQNCAGGDPNNGTPGNCSDELRCDGQ